MTALIDANRGADLPLTYTFPQEVSLNAFTGAFIIYDERNGDPLLTLTGTANSNGSVIAVTDNLVTLFVSKTDINALPLNADDDTSPAILAFDTRITGEGVTTKIHGGLFRVWPYGAKVSGGESDINVTLDGVVYDVSLVETGFDATTAALAKQYRDEAEQFAQDAETAATGAVKFSMEQALSIAEKLVALGNVSALVNPLALYGAVFDGTTDNAAAIDAAIAAGFIDLIVSGPCYIGSTKVYGRSVSFRFENDAKILKPGGTTITFLGQIIEENRQIFPNDGTIFCKNVNVAWFGADPTGVADSAPAFNAAWAAIEGAFGASADPRIGRAKYVMGPGKFLMKSPVSWSPKQNYPVDFIGAGTNGDEGTNIIGGNTADGWSGSQLILIKGQSSGLASAADFNVSGFEYYPKTTGQGPANGLVIGEIDKQLASSVWNTFTDVKGRDFTKTLRIAQARQLRFIGCRFNNDAVNNSIGVHITLDANASPGYTGDIIFRDCISTSANSGSRKGVVIESSVAGQTGISGIKFFNHTYYQCTMGLHVIASNGANVSDVWVCEGSQFDGTAANAIKVEASGSGSYVTNVNIMGVFMSGIVGTNIEFAASSSGVIRRFLVHGNMSNGSSGSFLLLSSGVSGGRVGLNSTSDFDISSNAVYEFGTSKNIVATANVLTRTGSQACGYMFSTQGASEDINITGNSAGGIPTTGIVRNTSSGIRINTTGNV